MRAIALSTLAAALCATAAVRPAAAQGTPQATAPSDTRRAEVAVAAARPVAEYRIETGRVGFPEHVTVSDSAGRIVASYRRVGDPVARPMAITVRGSDFRLRAMTPDGPLTIVLERQNGDVGPVLTGRWRIGAMEGPLRGTVTP